MSRRGRRAIRCLAPLLAATVVATLAFGVLAFVGAQPAQGAKTLEELEELIDEAEKEKSGLSKKIAELDKQLNKIESRLETLGDKIDDVSADLEKQQALYEKLNAELKQKQRELKQAELQLDWQQKVFDQRMVEAYKMGEVNYLDVLVESSGFDDFVTRIEFLKRLVESDDQLVGELTETRNVVKTQKHEVLVKTREARDLRDDLKQKNDELVALEAEQLAAQSTAESDRKEKNKALSKVESDIREWERQEAQLAAESQGLAGVITGLSGSGDGRSTGSMLWPCAGSLTSPFGWRIHPIFGVSKMHTGIDIGSGYGTPIKAADGGTVIYATWMSGYGNTTIIDHGGGISTLYAHQSNFRIASGPVSKGDVIGYVGSTGYSTGPHLHFEVRVGGNPVNPMSYL